MSIAEKHEKCENIKQEILDYFQKNGIKYNDINEGFFSIQTHGNHSVSQEITFEVDFDNEIEDGQTGYLRSAAVIMASDLDFDYSLPLSIVRELCEKMSSEDDQIEFNCDNYQTDQDIYVWGDIQTVANNAVGKVCYDFAEKLLEATDRAILRLNGLGNGLSVEEAMKKELQSHDEKTTTSRKDTIRKGLKETISVIKQPKIASGGEVHLRKKQRNIDGKLDNRVYINIRKELERFWSEKQVKYLPDVDSLYGVFYWITTPGSFAETKEVKMVIWDNDETEGEYEEGEEARWCFSVEAIVNTHTSPNAIESYFSSLDAQNDGIDYYYGFDDDICDISIRYLCNPVINSDIARLSAFIENSAEKTADAMDSVILICKALNAGVSLEEAKKAGKEELFGKIRTPKVIVQKAENGLPDSPTVKRLGEPGKFYKKMVYFHCPHCGADVSGPDEAFQRGCPVCSAPIDVSFASQVKMMVDGYYFVSYGTESIFNVKNKYYNKETLEEAELTVDELCDSDDILNWMRLAPHDRNNDNSDNIFSYLSACRERKYRWIAKVHMPSDFDLEASCSQKKDTIEKSPDILKEYIESLIKIERGIYSVKQRCLTLRIAEERQREAISQKAVYLSARQKELSKRLSEIQAQSGCFVEETTPYEEWPLKIHVPFKPEAPDALTLPVEPEYGTPGLFNKKRIQAENEAKKQKYELEKEHILLQYEADLASYEHNLDRYNSAIKRYEEAKAIYLKEQAEANEARRKLFDDDNNRQIRETEIMLASIQDALTNRVSWELPLQILTDERIMADKVLERLYRCRRYLYSANVVYEKYRNIVALTTFFEYLDSGRCNTLTGAAGAYNLYESELRQNLIISKLDDVLQSLETIINNQKLLYEQLENANYQLERLNNNMDKAIDELHSIRVSSEDTNEILSETNTMLNSVSINTAIAAQNSTVYAYYAERTAYYAEKNAELTNALGFLVALK